MRIVRYLLLILLVLLLLPYLVAPFYRAGHPVSTLMTWRWLKGAPVSRQWVDLNAMFLRVRHDLRRRVEARRLRVEERPAEYIQMLAFQLGAGVGDRSKGCRVACRACRRSD